eukprot:TRINITY_DN356_c2_g1_i4.p1 TRINITY_DN356_c2_g1~~TRINITY_DN356_c2_g1_i4.p1  ORF type:complete len:519 (-),score=101.86 TRINITY_DN356_c2_g1_i4:257-1813(-)
MPVIIKQRGSYTDVGLFSICAYPYTLKLLWSPIVDSLYFTKIGRRKTWILPAQFISGIIMLSISFVIDDQLNMKPLPIELITAIFFIFILLAATQDVAVDGWAIELLPDEKKHYQATCQGAGIGLGIFLSFTAFLMLNSVEFCNEYLRSSPSPDPIVTVGQYLLFWGIAFIVISIFVIFKKEESPSEDVAQNLTILQSYKNIWNLFKLPNIRWFALIMFFCEIGNITQVTLFSLRIVANEFSQHLLSLSSIIDLPITVITTLIATRFASNRPLTTFLVLYVASLVISPLMIVVIYFYPNNYYYGETIPLEYIVLIFFVLALIGSSYIARTTAKSSFIAKISDADIGGTYMTLLNTLSNIGLLWPRIALLQILDLTTTTTCAPEWPIDNSTFFNQTLNSTLSGINCMQPKTCIDHGGHCHVEHDGFYGIVTGCFVFGILFIYPLYKFFVPLEKEGIDWSYKGTDHQKLSIINEETIGDHDNDTLLERVDDSSNEEEDVLEKDDKKDSDQISLVDEDEDD